MRTCWIVLNVRHFEEIIYTYWPIILAGCVGSNRRRHRMSWYSESVRKKNEFTGKHLPKTHSLKHDWITSIGFEVFQALFLLHPNNLWHRLPRIPIVSCNTGAHSFHQVPPCRVYFKSSSSLELLFLIQILHWA